MTDLSALSDDQLKALYATHAAAPDLSKISDDDLKALHSSLPTHESAASDIAKSAGTGLVKGALGIAGMVPDISAAAHNVANKYLIDPILNATIGKPSGGAVPERTVDPNQMFGSESLQKGLESVTGELHKPQTVAGEYAQTAGEFAPGLLGGGEGLLARLGKQVLAPAVASETAGQITKGTEAEPYARIAGAVGGGGLASLLGREAGVAAPTIAELKASSNARYEHPDVKAVRFAAQPTEELANRASIDLRAEGFRPNLEQNGKPVFQLVDELRGASNVDDIHGVRKALGNLAKERDNVGQMTPNAAAATKAIDHINDFLPNLKRSDVLVGDAGKAATILKEAAQDYGAYKRAKDIATRGENALDTAGSTYGGGNANNAQRQALRPLSKNDFQKARGYNQDEKDALRAAVRGNFVGNTARAIGKLGPDTGLKGIHHIGAAVASGGTSIPFSLATLGAKLGGDFATRRAINRLDTMLRERSALHQENLARVNSPTIQSRVTPGVTLPNPHYQLPRQIPGPLPSGLTAALLAGQGGRLQSPTP